MLDNIQTVPYYKIKLPLMNREVSFRPYYVAEEVAFLTHLESQDKTNLIDSLIELTKNCVKQKEIFDEKLSLIDFTYLLVNIRGKSKGEKIELEKTCSKCNATEPFDFDVIKALNITNQGEVKKLVDVGNDINVEIGILPYDYLKDSSSIDDDNELKFRTIGYVIKKIVAGTEIHAKFTIDEVVEKFVKKLTTTQLKTIVDEMNTLANMKLVISCKCASCGHKEDIEMDNVLSFLF